MKNKIAALILSLGVCASAHATRFDFTFTGDANADLGILPATYVFTVDTAGLTATSSPGLGIIWDSSDMDTLVGFTVNGFD